MDGYVSSLRPRNMIRPRVPILLVPQNTETPAVFCSKDTLRVLRCAVKGKHRNTCSVHPNILEMGRPAEAGSPSRSAPRQTRAGGP